MNNVGHKGQLSTGQNAQGERYAPCIDFMVFYMPVIMIVDVDLCVVNKYITWTVYPMFPIIYYGHNY